METVAIVGVGLIGGSFALALRQAGFQGKFIGVSSPRTIEEALRLGVIDEALPLQEAAAVSDLIYLAQPISGILETITQLDAVVKPGSLVTDAGSTKGRIVQQAAQSLRHATFLGGHPMAGKETRGVGAADKDLFKDRPYVLTPVAPLNSDAPQVQAFVGWVRRIGARDIFLDPATHDRMVAFVSHLPQLTSTALAAMLGENRDLPGLEQIAGPGLMDNTRLALSAFEIWRDIFSTNLAYVNEALTSYIEVLRKIQAELSEPDLASGGLEDRFESGAAFATRLRRHRNANDRQP